MKQMCGRGKFFMAPGVSPNGKLRKFDDNRIFFYDGGNYGPSYGSPFSSPEFGLTSAIRAPFNPSGAQTFIVLNYKLLIIQQKYVMHSKLSMSINICNKWCYVGPISSMEQHLPMRMSMLGNGPPSGNSSLSLPHAMDEYSPTTAATTGASDTFIPPSHLLSTGSQAGAEDEIKDLLPNLLGRDRSHLELQLAGNYFL